MASSDDCDDTRATVYPGATEYCNELDDDCDGAVDEDAVDASIWYADADGDGYGDAAVLTYACSAGAGQTADGTDCDDTDAGIYGGGPEIADDGVDDDCDGRIDEVRVCADATGDFGTIQAAVDAAPVRGAVIEICPGTYYESVTLGDRVIEIDGETGDPEDVVIDGAGIGWAVSAEGGNQSSYGLDGITLIGDAAGALRLWSDGGVVTASHFVIRDTRLESGGCALSAQAAVVNVSDCDVRDNGGTASRLMILYDLGGAADGDSFLQRCYIHENGTDGDLGSILLESGVRINNNVFAKNYSSGVVVELNTIPAVGESYFFNNTLTDNVVAEGPVLSTSELDPFDSPQVSRLLVNDLICGNDASNSIMGNWGSCTRCDSGDSDHDCSSEEAIANCTIPSLEYEWACEAATDLCVDYWCTQVLTGPNFLGMAIGISSTTDPPYGLPAGSPAIDGGDAGAEYIDVDGTRNDPGRYGGPNAFE